MLPEIGLAKGACTLWEEELLFDYTIEVEDECFKVHKVVMASVSDYFKVMLTGGMVESREERVRLEGLSSLAVEIIIKFVYTGQLSPAEDKLKDVLACAVYLQIPAAVKICTASLSEEVNTENCFHILSIFKAYTNKDCIEHTIKFIKQNIEAIMVDCNHDDLTYEEFLNLMELWERSEWELFTAVREWLNADLEKRKQHVNDIMSHVRFCLMSPTEVISIKDLDLFLDHDGPWQDLVEKALAYHKLLTHQKVLDDSEQSKVRSDPAPVCFRMQPSFRGQLFALDKERWVSQETVNPPSLNPHTNGDKFLTYVEANNFLILSDHHGEHDTKWYIYDPRNQTWCTMPSTEIPRHGFALCYHDKSLYAFGGRDRRDRFKSYATDVIEKFDFETNSWSIIDSKMPARLIHHSAFSIGNCIYVTEGYLTRYYDLYPAARLDCFEPHTGKWSEKSVECLWHLGTSLVTVDIDSEKVLAGVDIGFTLHYYKPSTDQWLRYNLDKPTELQMCRTGYLLAEGRTIFLLEFERNKEVEEETTSQSTDEDVSSSQSTDEDESTEQFGRFLDFPQLFGDRLSGACEKWTLDNEGPRLDVLNDFPRLSPPTDDPYDDPIDNFCVLLSHPIRQ